MSEKPTLPAEISPKRIDSEVAEEIRTLKEIMNGNGEFQEEQKPQVRERLELDKRLLEGIDVEDPANGQLKHLKDSIEKFERKYNL